MTVTSRYLVVGNLAQVVDRRTGKPVWERNGQQTGASASSVTGNLLACSQDNIAILDNGSLFNGIDLVSGAHLWSVSKSDLPEKSAFLGLYGSVFVIASSDGTPGRFFDAHSGRRLDPDQNADASFLRRSANQAGTVLVARNYLTRFRLLNLVTGEDTNIPSLSVSRLGYYVIPIAVTDGQILCFVDEDNDSAGGSQFPKYLASFNLHGHRLWQFPRRIVQDGNRGGVGASYQSRPLWLPAAHCLIAFSEAGVYGVSARAGRQLWHRTPLKQSQVWHRRLPYARGMLLSISEPKRSGVSAAPDTETIYYLDAATGTLHRLLGGLPRPSSLAAGGDQVFLLDAQGVVRAYRLTYPPAASTMSRASSQPSGAVKL